MTARYDAELRTREDGSYRACLRGPTADGRTATWIVDSVAMLDALDPEALGECRIVCAWSSVLVAPAAWIARARAVMAPVAPSPRRRREHVEIVMRPPERENARARAERLDQSPSRVHAGTSPIPASGAVPPDRRSSVASAPIEERRSHGTAEDACS